MLSDMRPTLKYNQEVMHELIETQDQNRLKVFRHINNWCNS
jgi:hypothetical protein